MYISQILILHYMYITVLYSLITEGINAFLQMLLEVAPTAAACD